MMKRIGAGRTFLGRLARDVRGNTIAMMAAALMPLAGLIGGGVDMSRLYLTKTRVQQACDAGALAGRKAMGAGGWTTQGSTSTNSRAESMFTANFVAGDFGTGTLTKSFTESNGVVTGTSTVVVPMTIMKVFGMSTRTIRVTCQAKMEIPNTDVMFVLDVTGSMACPAGSTSYCGYGTPKLDGLKSAVKCFYEALEKVNTTEVCGNDPTATTADTTAQIRLGFVPYSVNVNVGRLLPHNYMADSWTYQSREANYTTQNVVTGYTPGASASVTDTNYSNNGSWGSWSNWNTYSNIYSSSACNNLVPSGNYVGNGSEGSAYGGGTYTSGGNQITYWYTDEPATRYSYQVGSYSSYYDTCTIQRRQRNATITRTYSRTDTPVYTQQQVFSDWTYKPVTFNVSSLKSGSSAWNDTVSLPIGTSGAATDVTWDGCIEERQTYRNTNGSPQNDWSPIPASAYDMNIDMVPSDLVANSKWGPMLGDATWGPYTAKSCSWLGCSYTRTAGPYTTSSDLDHNNGYTCPTAARKLTVYNTSGGLETYINSFAATGATYHDIGMLWGARLLSPTGIFASENAYTPSGRAIQRHLIFMTDGDTNTSDSEYSAYGIGYWSRRQTSYDPSNTQMNDMTNARLVALCTAIKNMNITLWVVSFGGGVNETTETRLSACATPGRYYSASDNAALISRFRQIASEISELRLTS